MDSLIQATASLINSLYLSCVQELHFSVRNGMGICFSDYYPLSFQLWSAKQTHNCITCNFIKRRLSSAGSTLVGILINETVGKVRDIHLEQLYKLRKEILKKMCLLLRNRSRQSFHSEGLSVLVKEESVKNSFK